jgi:N-glycosylase/DNA lyase
MRSVSAILDPPAGFSFATTVRSHGWYDLAPFAYDEARGVLSTAVTLDEARAARLTLTPRAGGAIALRAVGADIRPGDRRALLAAARRILALDVDLGALYARLATDPARAWAVRTGAGRFLRAPSLWEDVVKLVLTTNCSWAFTAQMVTRLVGSLGIEAAPNVRAFPTPAAMAAQNERFYRATIRAGYRSTSLASLARKVAAGEINLDALVASNLTGADARKALIALPGVGPYVAENLLRILGRNDFLGLDSWSRSVYAKRIHNGGRSTRRPPSDRTIERAYRRFGRNAGLVFWLDVTHHWHEADATDGHSS